MITDHDLDVASAYGQIILVLAEGTDEEKQSILGLIESECGWDVRRRLEEAAYGRSGSD